VWQSVGAGVTGAVWALANDQGTIVVGGEFDSVYGGFEGGTLAAGDIARWTGKFWDVLNGGFHEHYQGVHAIAVTPTGLYAGGDFETTTHGDSVHNIARYDGVQWNAVGGGIKRWRGALPVWKIAPWHNGIAVAGYFMAAGTVPGSGIALWDGIEWTPMYGQEEEVHTQAVSAFNGSIAYTGEFGMVHPGLTAFVSYDGHSVFPVPSPGVMPGPLTVINGAVVIGQSPIHEPETSFNNLAMFNAGNWESIDGGVNNTVMSLSPDKNGTGFLVSGYFSQAGGEATNGFAIWRPNAGVDRVATTELKAPFPNPAHDQLLVSSPKAVLLNALGVVLDVPTLQVAEGTTFDLRGIAAGIYFVKTDRGVSSVVKR
jgi:hypothetical protein